MQMRGPALYPFVVDSGAIAVSFRCHSGSFRFFPARSGSFRSSPVRSGPGVRFVLVRSGNDQTDLKNSKPKIIVSRNFCVNVCKNHATFVLSLFKFILRPFLVF